MEDQNDGFVFWKRAERTTVRPTDMFPIAIEVPLPLKNSGYEFFLRTDIEDAEFTVVENLSSPENYLDYLNEGLKVMFTKIRLGMGGRSIASWRMPGGTIGKRTSYLMLPSFVESLDREHVVTIQLVGGIAK